MFKIANFVFMGAITAAAMAAGSNSVSAQTSTGSPQFKAAKFVNWLMSEDFLSRSWGEEGSKMSGYTLTFTNVVNSKCNYLPADVANVVKHSYERTRNGQVGDLKHRLVVEGAIIGIEDARLFVNQYGCSSPDSRKMQIHLLKMWEQAIGLKSAEQLPDNPGS